MQFTSLINIGIWLCVALNLIVYALVTLIKACIVYAVKNTVVAWLCVYRNHSLAGTLVPSWSKSVEDWLYHRKLKGGNIRVLSV